MSKIHYIVEWYVILQTDTIYMTGSKLTIQTGWRQRNNTAIRNIKPVLVREMHASSVVILHAESLFDVTALSPVYLHFKFACEVAGC